MDGGDENGAELEAGALGTAPASRRPTLEGCFDGGVSLAQLTNQPA